jgi:hypothetical protein
VAQTSTKLSATDSGTAGRWLTRSLLGVAALLLAAGCFIAGLRMSGDQDGAAPPPPATLQETAEAVGRDALLKLAEHFDAHAAAAATASDSRKWGEALKSGNIEAVRNAFAPVNEAFGAVIGGETADSTEDRWNAAEAARLAREVAAGLREAAE